MKKTQRGKRNLGERIKEWMKELENCKEYYECKETYKELECVLEMTHKYNYRIDTDVDNFVEADIDVVYKAMDIWLTLMINILQRQKEDDDVVEELSQELIDY